MSYTTVGGRIHGLSTTCGADVDEYPHSVDNVVRRLHEHRMVESVIDEGTSMHLHIAHLYPAQMNIYGDRGNIIVLRQRSLWRGIDVTVDAIHPGASVDWSRYDLCFFGGGQDSGQALIADDFVVRHGAELRAALADGVVMLAICGGYQLLGNYFKTHAGQTLPGIGALDVHTVGGTQRFIGNIAVTVDVPIAQRHCIGFENHSGQTFLGSGARPLGTVIAGSGNNGYRKGRATRCRWCEHPQSCHLVF